jgi:uncharacterized membrane protein YhhN
MNLLGVIVLLMVVEWVVVAKKWKKLRVITKPAPMIAMIIWFNLMGKWQGPLFYFGMGLVFSLLGDILLLLSFRYFIFGLVAFSLAHFFYIVGFNVILPEFGVIFWILLAAVILAAFSNFRPILNAMRKDRYQRRLTVPLLFYAIIISLMLFSALLNTTRPGWGLQDGLLTCLGAILFYISDSLLARERFIRSTKFGGLLVMVSYLLGQLFIALGVLNHYIP